MGFSQGPKGHRSGQVKSHSVKILLNKCTHNCYNLIAFPNNKLKNLTVYKIKKMLKNNINTVQRSHLQISIAGVEVLNPDALGLGIAGRDVR